MTNWTNSTLEYFSVSPTGVLSSSALSSVATGTNPTSIVISGNYAYVANYGSSTLESFSPIPPTATVTNFDSTTNVQGLTNLQGNAAGFMTTIQNTSSFSTSGSYNYSSDGLLIQLGTPQANWTTGNTFIAFGDTSGNINGNISAVAGGGVSYNTTGADYAEYFNFNPNSSLITTTQSNQSTVLPTPSYLVSLTSTGSVALSNNTMPIGIVSKDSGFIGNGPSCNINQPSCLTTYYASHVLVSLRGQVPLTVSNQNGTIAVGDPITSSSIPGVGELATTPGYIVGYALTTASTNGTIQVLVDPGYYNPSAITTQGTNPIFDSLTVNGALTASSINDSGVATIATLTVTGNTTIDGNLTVIGMTTVNNITINGHIITSGNTPQISALTNAGTNAKVTITGNDTAGTITITTGSATTTVNSTGQTITSGNNPSVGDQVSLIYSKPYISLPHVLITPNNAISTGIEVYPSNQNNNGFIVSVNQQPVPNTTYMFKYFVVQ